MAREKLNANRITNDGYNPTNAVRERVNKHDSQADNNTVEAEKNYQRKQDNTNTEEINYQELTPPLDAALFKELWKQIYAKTKFKAVLFIMPLLFLLVSLLMVFNPNQLVALFTPKPSAYMENEPQQPIQSPKNLSIALSNSNHPISVDDKTSKPTTVKPKASVSQAISTAQVVNLDFASNALLTAKDHIDRVTGKILIHYPHYLSLSQQILSLRQIYTGIFTKINRGAMPNPLVYKSFVQRLEQIAKRCQILNQKQADWTAGQEKNLQGLKQSLENYRDKIQQLNNYDPELKLAYPQNDNGQLQYILATNIAEQISILSEFDSLAQQLQQYFKHYIKAETMLLNLMSDYSVVLRLSVDTLSIQYKASVINESTETVYQLYGYLEKIAQQQKQIRQQQQQLKHRFLAQYG